MKDKGIKVIVDYNNGCCNIVGTNDNFYIRKKIDYSRSKERQQEFLEILLAKDPDFVFSRKTMNKIDPLICEALKEFDDKNDTDYLKNYLETMLKPINGWSLEDRNVYEKNIRRHRLKYNSIDISYNIGLLNTSKEITFLDKVKGVLFANNHKKLCDAKVNKSITLKNDYYLPENTQEKNIEENSNSLEVPQDEHLKKVLPYQRLMEQLSVESDIRKSEAMRKAEKDKKVAKKVEIEKSINSTKAFFHRKINDVKESIKSLKFKSNPNKNKRLIKGAISILSAGAIFAGVNLTNDLSNSKNNNNLNPSSNYIDVEVTESSFKLGTENKIDINEITSNNEKVENIFSEDNKIDNNLKEENISEKDNEEVKTDNEKIAEFTKIAIQKYKQEIKIGENLNIGDILDNQTYSQNPDGSGNIGYFALHKNYGISHINIVTKDGVTTVRTEGKNLDELLAEYPDCVTYNIHFINLENGGGLGFVTKEQYEQVVQNKVNEIINSKTEKNLELDDDMIR